MQNFTCYIEITQNTLPLHHRRLDHLWSPNDKDLKRTPRGSFRLFEDLVNIFAVNFLAGQTVETIPEK
jgi:hypothetical protein